MQGSESFLTFRQKGAALLETTTEKHFPGF